MEKQFQLTLTNRLKLVFLLIGGMLVLLIGVVTAGKMATTLALSKGVETLIALVVLAGVMYGVYWLIKRLSAEPVQVSIAPDTFTIAYTKSGVEQQWPLAAIAAYRHSSYNSDDILRLTWRDGTRTKLVVSGTFHGGQAACFGAMVGQLEAALEKYSGREEHSTAVREKTFFEKPVSTVVLVAFAAIMAFVIWQVIIDHKPIRGSFFASIGSFITYVLAWYAGRGKRSN